MWGEFGLYLDRKNMNLLICVRKFLLVFSLGAFLGWGWFFYLDFWNLLNVHAAESKDTSFIPPTAYSDGSVTYVLKSRQLEKNESTAEVSLNFPELIDCESSDSNGKCLKFIPKVSLPFHPEDPIGSGQPKNTILKFGYYFYESRIPKVLAKSHEVQDVGETLISLFYDGEIYEIDRRVRLSSLLLPKNIYYSLEARCRLGRKIGDGLYELRNMNHSEFLKYEEKTSVNILPYCFGVPETIYPQFTVDGKVKSNKRNNLYYFVLFNKKSISSAVGRCILILPEKKRFRCYISAIFKNKIKSEFKVHVKNMSDISDMYKKISSIVDNNRLSNQSRGE